jgi:hypothetical protein
MQDMFLDKKCQTNKFFDNILKKPPTASINMVTLVSKNQKNEEQVSKKREPLKKNGYYILDKRRKDEENICENNSTTIYS